MASYKEYRGRLHGDGVWECFQKVPGKRFLGRGSRIGHFSKTVKSQLSKAEQTEISDDDTRRLDKITKSIPAHGMRTAKFDFYSGRYKYFTIRSHERGIWIVM